MTEGSEIRYKALDLALKYAEKINSNDLVEVATNFEDYIRYGHEKARNPKVKKESPN